jgi:hypothetical protein
MQGRAIERALVLTLLSVCSAVCIQIGRWVSARLSVRRQRKEAHAKAEFVCQKLTVNMCAIVLFI